MRRPASTIIAATVAAAALAVPTQASGSPTGTTTSSAAAAQAQRVATKQPARPGKKCRKRLQNVRDVVPAKRFANCVVKAMLKGSTVHLSSSYSDGMSNAGDGRFTKKGTDASVTYSDGQKLVVLDGKAWHKQAGRPWVRAKQNGNPDETLAWTIQQLWVGLSSPAAYKSYLRASSTGWTPTGRNRKVNGVQAREYAGTVTLGGVAFDDYTVWLDKWDRPLRISTTTTFLGQAQTGVQDFKKWGRAVNIKKPI